ncbi:hypothetical protein Tco_1147365 [Tanacetum coccineum]
MMVVEGSGGGWLGCVIVAWFHSNEGGSLVRMMAVKRKQKSFFRLLKRKQEIKRENEGEIWFDDDKDCRSLKVSGESNMAGLD